MNGKPSSHDRDIVLQQDMERVEVSLESARTDCHFLDRMPLPPAGKVRLLALEDFTQTHEDSLAVKHVELHWGLSKVLLLPLLRDILCAWRILSMASKGTAIIAYGGNRGGKLIPLLNYLLPIRRRNIVLWGAFIETKSRLNSLLNRWMILGCTVSLVWSKKQVESQAQYLGVPQQKFIFLPYKANHSKRSPISISLGNYVFSGGNSQRDYRTLFAAIAGTDIPVIVSATDPEVLKGLEVPANVILVAAREPYFARLIAGSRFVVIPLNSGLVRGAGEASICNAMWHGKPVIAADDTSASDYIQDGITGYVVAAGDVASMKDRVVRLWNDSTSSEAMGSRAHEQVRDEFTHVHFVRRLKCMGLLSALTDAPEGLDVGMPRE